MNLFGVVSQLASGKSFIPVVIDCGTAVTKVTHRGRMLWEHPTVIAVERLTGDCVSLGTIAAQQLSADASHQLRMINPVQNGLVSNTAVLHYYLDQLLKQLVWVDGSKISAFAPLVLLCQSEQSVVARKQWLEACGNLGRRVSLISEKDAVLLVRDQIKLPTWIVDFGYSHTSCSCYDADGFVAESTFPWGLNRLYAMLEKATAQLDVLLTQHQLEMVLQQIVVAPTKNGSSVKRKISLTAKQLSTGSSKQVVFSEKDIETYSGALLAEWLWMVSQHVLHLTASFEKSKVPTQLCCFGGGSLIRGLSAELATGLSLQLQDNLAQATSLAVPLSQHYERT